MKHRPQKALIALSAEIGEVCRLTEHALWAALKRSYRSGLIRKVGHARYQAPLRGPTVIP